MVHLERIGPLLRRLREERNLTQDALAWKAGVSRSYLQHLEHGRSRDVKISTLGSICEGLGVSLKHFFQMIEDDSVPTPMRSESAEPASKPTRGPVKGTRKAQ